MIKLSKGKYSDKTLQEVFECDFNYFKWLVKEKPDFVKESDFESFEFNPKDHVIRFGKYRNSRITEIQKVDPSYFKFLCQKKDTFNDWQLVESIEHFALYPVVQ
jgi:O-glycosyl hydrolase